MYTQLTFNVLTISQVTYNSSNLWIKCKVSATFWW